MVPQAPGHPPAHLRTYPSSLALISVALASIHSSRLMRPCKGKAGVAAAVSRPDAGADSALGRSGSSRCQLPPQPPLCLQYYKKQLSTLPHLAAFKRLDDLAALLRRVLRHAHDPDLADARHEGVRGRRQQLLAKAAVMEEGGWRMELSNG